MTPRKIPLCKPHIGKEEEKAMQEVLRSGWLTHGQKNKEFEENFAKYIGTSYAISLNSCTSALFLALKAKNITGEVIVPSFTFVASANAIITAGAIPIFADIDYETCMLDPKSVEAAITPNTEALMVVHFAGQAAPMTELQQICERHNLLLIEDSAEAIGAEYENKKTGAFGIGCFSFFPTKNITTGEGGMLTTNDSKMAETVSILAAHGVKKTNNPPHIGYRSAILPGYNFRMSNLLAALGVEQLKKLEYMNRQRKAIAQQYTQFFSTIPEITVPQEKTNRKHVYQMYTIKVAAKKRNSLVEALNKVGIEASVHFNPPVHLQEYYSKTTSIKLSITEQVSKEILTLPLYPDMTPEDITYVCETIRMQYT